MDNVAILDRDNYVANDYRHIYERINLLADYKSKNGKKDIILNLIVDLIIQELGLRKDKLTLKNHSIEFRLQTPQSELVILITHTDVDNMISIVAIIPSIFNKEYTRDLADQITQCNSSSKIVPLGRILMKRTIGLICVENQFICKSEEDFSQEEFMTYFSATVVSAGRLYPRISEYLLKEGEPQ